MVTAAKVQESRFEGIKRVYSQAASSKFATSAAQTTQNAAKKVLNIGTHPVFVYFVASNAMLAYMADTSITRMLLLNMASSLTGISAAFLAGYGRMKMGRDPGIQVSIKKIPVSIGALDITSKNYNSEVLASKTPVLLNAYATGHSWPHRREIGPGITELVPDAAKRILNKKLVQIKCVQLNVKEEPLLAKELGIQKMPAYLVFKDGKIVDRVDGATSDHLEKLVKSIV